MLIFLIPLVTSLEFGTKDEMDPGQINWPKSDWSVNPIELSSNNAGSISDIKFTFNPSTTLASGVFLVNFPDGFPDKTRHISGVSLISGQDITLTIQSVQLPSAKGVYGPVSIMTRVSEQGNIIDLNKIFSNIPISEKRTAANANSLEVSFENGDSALISSKQSLIFSFILSQDLWKHDLFKLQVDQKFLIEEEKCESLVSFIKGSSQNDSSMIECEFISSESTLYLYGLSNDLTISDISSTGSVLVEFKVSTFTMPDSAYAASDFTWNMFIYRYGTSTVIEEYTGKGPSIINGDITIKSWAPANYLPVDQIVSGLTTYMDLIFTLSHIVPSSGQLIISFSGIDIKKTVWKSDSSQSTSSGSNSFLLISPYIGGSCSVSTSQVTCKDFSQDINPGTLTVSVLARFSGSSAQVSYIVTMTKDGDLIDRNLQGQSVVYAISVKQQVLTHFSLQFASDNAGTLVSDTMSNAIAYICFKAPVSIPKTTVLTLYLPINTGAEKDFTIGLSQTTLKAKLLSSSSLLASGYNFFTSSLVSLSDPTISAGKLVISLSGLSSSTTSTDYLYIFLTSDASSSVPGVKLPRSASTLSTMYEAVLNFSVNGLIYKSSQVITVTPMSLGATASLLCTDKDLKGIPLSISFLPPLSYSLDSGSKLIVEVKFDSNYDSDLGSGITGTYPVYTLLEKVTFTLIEDSVARLQMTGLSTYLSTKTYSFTFPVGKMLSSLEIDIRLFFITSDRIDIEYEVMKTSVSIAGTSTATTFSSTSIETVPSSGVSIADPFIGEKFALEVAPLLGSGIYNSGYLGVVLPEGFKLDNQEVYLTSDSGIVADVLYAFSSDDDLFKLTSVVFELSSSISISSVTPSITIKEWQAPTYSISVDISIFLSPSSQSSCVAYGDASSITIKPAVLEEPTFSPDKTQARSASSLIADIETSFTITYKVPGGISLTLGSSWSVSDLTSYTIEGLSGTIKVKLTGNTFYISGFDEIRALTAVTFGLTNLSPPSTTGQTGHFDQITTYKDSAFLIPIESWTDPSEDSCTIVEGGSSSTSSFQEVSVFPNSAGAKSVYLYLKFTLPHSIPQSGRLIIYSPFGFLGVGDQSENCWLSVKYSSCEIVEDFLLITLAERYGAGNQIDLILDVAFDLPDQSGVSLEGFAVSSDYNGVEIDRDSLFEFKSAQKLEVLPEAESVITMGQFPLRIEPSTEGELALYSFSFSINVTVETSDSFLFSFPYEFDHLLGDAEVKFRWGDPSSYYLNCSSQTLSTVTCKVDHWNLIISDIPKSVEAGTLIDLNVSYIRNPEYTGRIFNDIGIYLFNATNIKAVHNEYSGVTVSKAASVARIKSVYSEEPKLQSTSSYTIKFFLDWTDLSSNDHLIIQFPSQYKLNLENSKSLNPLKCSATWSDQSPTSLDSSAQVWNSEIEDCEINNLNQVIWAIKQSKLFLQTDLVSLTITGLKNPEWGFKRSIEQYKQDSSVFGDYDVWTQKLEVITYSGKYFRYISKSYNFLHSGFLGFYSGGQSAQVNSFDAQTKEGFITLLPGSQSKDIVISISSDFLKAKKLRFLPSNHQENEVKLEFTSDISQFIMKRDLNSILFRVSVPITAANSLNYIDWVLEEVSLDGLVAPAYISPVRTLVEVYDQAKISFVIGAINAVYLEVDSIPIKIHTDYAPNQDIIVALGLLDRSIKGVSFKPSALLFTQDMNSLFFSIFVSNETFTGKLSTPIYIEFTLTGHDSGRFSDINPVSFEVEEKSSLFASQISLLTFAELSQTGLNLRLKINTASLVYWVFGPSDCVFPEFDELSIPDLVDNSDFFEDQVKVFYSGLDNTPKNGESWEDFQRRLYAEFLGRTWLGVSYVDAGITTDLVTFKWLWAETSYTVKVLVDNKSGYFSNSSFTQATADKNPAIRVYVKFKEEVSSVFEPVIKNALSLALGILSELLFDPQIKLYEFSWVFGTDRASPLAPSTIVTKIDSKILRANLDYAGIFNEFTVESKILAQNSFEVPEWKTVPDLVEVESDFVTFNSSIIGKGKVCCVVLSNSTTKSLSIDQIYTGVNGNNIQVPNICFSSENNTVYENQIKGLNEGTQYTLTCTVCSLYPIWPACSENYYSFDFSSTAKFEIKDDDSFSIPLLTLIPILYFINL